MITIRRYGEEDAESVGRLIADTYTRFNLSSVPPEELGLFLGPFQHAWSPQQAHQEAIAVVLRAAMVFVAEDDGRIVGVLRGKSDKLQSLFVSADHQRQGVGRRLVQCFEQECERQGSAQIRVQATLYGVPFYQAMGYRRTTGARAMRSFEGRGLQYQPMKKVLPGGR